ncbi:MAG: adenylyltransferase/cytidyltransferase family protein [Rhodobacteraceae bacterium]|nr:adenylyltransferase/cytidyltransferase family protein [Paracoccaceae bacterium]
MNARDFPRHPRMGVIDENSASEKIQALKDNQLVVGLCHGCFDVLHFGHLRHLMSAASMCDALIVSVTANRYVNKGPERPIFDEKYRAEMLSGLACVDGVVISNSPSAIMVLDHLKPNKFFKGQEYHLQIQERNQNFLKERDYAESKGIEVIHTFEETFSSTETLNRLYKALKI